MSAAEAASAISAAEAKDLLRPFVALPALLIAVSGGPDSTALMFLAARWRRSRRRGPRLLAVTVDHGLRPRSAQEARDVGQLARSLGIAHRTVRWRGRKPVSGLQQAARAARYRLLGEAAARAGCSHIATAHTLDDQAETVLLRLIRGSGPGGLAGMAPAAPLPVPGAEGITLVRPLLAIPKARLLATLSRAGIAFAEDPLNRDPRFTRARLREAMPSLAAEGLDARRLARLAQRMRRAEAAIERAVEAAAADASQAPWSAHVAFDAEELAALPEEIALRLLGRAVVHVGGRGRRPGVPLERLEALHAALRQAQAARGGARRLRRSLQGTLVTLAGERISVEPAPPRRALTTAGRRGLARGKPR